MTATITNGKPARKQLSHELDRLDGVIDLLADALPGAVAEAARDGVRQAVREAIAEALAGPELRELVAKLAPAQAHTPAPAAPVAPPKPTAWARLKSALIDLRRRAESAALSLAIAIAARLLAAKPAAESAVRFCVSLWRVRHTALLGAAFGLLTAAGCYLAPRAASAAVGGLSGAAVAVAGRAWRISRPCRDCVQGT